MRLNELILNGKSTADFPFKVYIEEFDDYQIAPRKQTIVSTDYMTGGTKVDMEAWGMIEKEYVLHCPMATKKDMRVLTGWLVHKGELIASDEPDVYYEVLQSRMEKAPLEKVSGYRVHVAFICQPFGFQHKQETRLYQDGSQLVNHTEAPMFPRITVRGSSNTQTWLRIGEQKVYFKQLDRELTIECKYLEQNVFDKYGTEINSIFFGDFFIIPAHSSNTVEYGPGLTEVLIKERWCHLS